MSVAIAIDSIVDGQMSWLWRRYPAGCSYYLLNKFIWERGVVELDRRHSVGAWIDILGESCHCEVSLEEHKTWHTSVVRKAGSAGQRRSFSRPVNFAFV